MTVTAAPVLPAIDTVAQLDALPVGAVIRGARGGVWEVDESETDGTAVRYVGTSVSDYHTARVLLELYGPFTVLWSGETSESALSPAPFTHLRALELVRERLNELDAIDRVPLHIQADLEQLLFEAIDLPQSDAPESEAGARALERAAKVAEHLPSRDADRITAFLTSCAAELRSTGTVQGEDL